MAVGFDARSYEQRREIRGRLLHFLGRHRAAVQLSIDGIAWCVGLFVALCVRYDFANGWERLIELVQFVPLLFMCQVWMGLFLGLYLGRWRFGSFDEVAALAGAASTSAVLLSVANVAVLDRWVPASVPLGAGVIALVVMLGARYVWRLAIERHRRPQMGDAEPILVIGAGEGAAQIVTTLLRDPESPYLPVGLLDDDPMKANLRICGVPVLGPRASLAAATRAANVRTALLAIPSASGELVRDVTAAASAAGLTLRLLPTVAELLGGAVSTKDIRLPSLADLLGRREIDTDLASIAGYLTDKRVLVTGAGGSIGSELCRQLRAFHPAEIIMLDRDESALHAVQLSMEGAALLDTPNLVVADIRDGGRLDQVMADWRPQVVFHAAALKHLPLLEMHPSEAVKTNVVGTQLVLEASLRHGVERFVNISTDKAANPISVLGYTKRISERLTSQAGTSVGSGTYLSVRFGNVLGTRGSVLTTFQSQIASGGPITVTHPEVERFFMTVVEAVQLVIQAGAIGADGEVLVLDMGNPIRIADVARMLVAQAEADIELVFTGLRPGEKLSEELWGLGERGVASVHPLIAHVPVDPLVLDVDVVRSQGMTRPELEQLCSTQPASTVTP